MEEVKNVEVEGYPVVRSSKEEEVVVVVVVVEEVLEVEKEVVRGGEKIRGEGEQGRGQMR